MTLWQFGRPVWYIPCINICRFINFTIFLFDYQGQSVWIYTSFVKFTLLGLAYVIYARSLRYKHKTQDSRFRAQFCHCIDYIGTNFSLKISSSVLATFIYCHQMCWNLLLLMIALFILLAASSLQWLNLFILHEIDLKQISFWIYVP